MEPVFTIKTHLSEDDYRRGLKATLNYFGLLPLIGSIVLMTSSIIWLCWVMITNSFEPDIILLILTVILTATDISAIYKVVTLPKKSVQQGIDMLVMKTGSPELDIEILFLDDKVQVNYKNTSEPRYFLYNDFNKVVELSDMLIFESVRHFAVYIKRADIDDTENFFKFMQSKCPAMKLVKK